MTEEVFGVHGNNVHCWISYILSTLLGVIYVGSIYVWKQSSERSNHHSVIKKRIVSVFAATVLSYFYVNYFINSSLLKDDSIWALLGFRWNGLLNAIFLPILLTSILFLGPILIDTFSGTWWIPNNHDWASLVKDMVWIRNYIFAPITEEFVFRACMLNLIIHCTKPLITVFVCPLFFGAAHLHHMLEQVRFGDTWKNAILTSSFQFLFTSAFGSYSAYLFLRTGHIIAPILVHSFCNAMGVPHFDRLNELSPNQRIISIGALVIGFGSWIILLSPLTDPSLYGNKLPWVSEI